MSYNNYSNEYFKFNKTKKYKLDYMSINNQNYVILQNNNVQLTCEYKIMLFSSIDKKIIIPGFMADIKYDFNFKNDSINSIIKKYCSKYCSKYNSKQNYSLDKICKKIYIKIFKISESKLEGIVFDVNEERIVCLIITNIIKVN